MSQYYWRTLHEKETKKKMNRNIFYNYVFSYDFVIFRNIFRTLGVTISSRKLYRNNNFYTVDVNRVI